MNFYLHVQSKLNWIIIPVLLAILASYAALWVVASGYQLTLAAQDRFAGNSGFFPALRFRPVSA